ncbi:polysaccharide biosynthesis protein [Paracoccus sphaerophysae]|uniref:hypothetical protein n=1 Tax=Paracoccus sphaerophysae TaxID=690417 RepID=UPI0012EBC8D3|nr:hypothetical protein [Paracoccus sphaerophysae]
MAHASGGAERLGRVLARDRLTTIAATVLLGSAAFAGAGPLLSLWGAEAAAMRAPLAILICGAMINALCGLTGQVMTLCHGHRALLGQTLVIQGGDAGAAAAGDRLGWRARGGASLDPRRPGGEPGRRHRHPPAARGRSGDRRRDLAGRQGSPWLGGRGADACGGARRLRAGRGGRGLRVGTRRAAHG